jgi:Flp pilus assembly protein TadG
MIPESTRPLAGGDPVGSKPSPQTDRERVDRRRKRARRGVAVPLIAISLVALCGFVALAVDVSRMAVARDQCQIAADTAAMTGARALNGIYPQDLTAASAQAAAGATALTVLGAPIDAGNITTTHGTYRYDRNQQKFVPNFTLQTGEAYNLTQSTVSYSCPTTFARIFGYNAFNVSATAMAAHRPRDITVVLDYSGSMNVESDLWNNWWPYDNGASAPNNPNNTSNNCETVYPKFGHYSNEKNYSNYTNYANLLCPAADAGNALTGNSAIGKCNISVSALGVPAMVNDFWQNARGSSASSGFTAAPDAALDAYNQAGGDLYMRKNSNTAGQPYAATVAEIFNGSTSTNATWESTGYKMLTGVTFNGYVR